jgi:S1-C subfamily serine protease
MRQLRLPLFSGLVGGGLVAVLLLAIGIDSSSKTTTTVVQQAPIASTSAASADGDKQFTPREIYKRDAPGVVYIRAQVVQRTQSPFDMFPTEQQGEATGSGFVIDRNGDILTNAHVIDGAVKVTVQFGDNKSVEAKIVGKDVSSDIALLKIDPDGVDLHPLSLGSAKDVQVGDPTIAIGNPFGLDRTLTTGVVSALQRRITAPSGFEIKDVIQTDAAINPGNSGGPLIDAAGRVIGINSQIETGGNGANGNVGIGFAVPIDTAKQILDSLKNGKTVQRAYLGVISLTVDGQLDALDLPVDHGALVQSVEPGSPADAAGLKAGDLQAQLQGQGSNDPVVLGGDIITKLDGKDITSSDQLAQLVAAHKPGEKVKMEIVRKKDTKTLTVTLGKRPPTLQTG